MCEDGLHDPFTDQVECARFKAERDALAQRMEEIASEIDRTLSGVEGIEDAPAMRWMRGLREALGALHSPRIGYEDIEAAKWVRGHGGLDKVNRKVAESMQQADEYIALRCSLAERAGDLYEMLEKEDDELIAMLDKRLMPEGMELLVEAWPRFEDGEPVRIGDEVSWRDEGGVVNSIELQDGGYFTLHAADGAEDWILPQYFPGERVKRPAPKVLDADGAEIREGDTVWRADNGKEYWVRKGHQMTADAVVIGLKTNNDCADETVDASVLTHRAPVLAADGRPLREGETVWGIDSGTRYTVEKNTDELIPIKCRSEMGTTVSLHPSQLTHERPDSWKRLEEDAEKQPYAYCDLRGVVRKDTTIASSVEGMARDIVRRAKALAGKED